MLTGIDLSKIEKKIPWSGKKRALKAKNLPSGRSCWGVQPIIGIFVAREGFEPATKGL
jgi:hypothetical protein